MKELLKIQANLKAPKNLKNAFWNYKYRSCESILEALKPLLRETETILLLNDELVLIWSRYYIKSTATLINKDWLKIETVWFAREEENKKWMDGSQITWASSSYARKYALNWLFAIDDGVDSDKTNKHWKEEKTNWEIEFKNCKTLKDLQEIYLKSPKTNELIILKDSLKLNLK